MSETGALPLSVYDVALAGMLVLLAGAVSVWLRLGIAGRLFIAAMRTVLQLAALGYVLAYIFAIEHPALVFAAVAVMTVAAGRVAVQRSSRRYRGIHLDAFFTLLIAGTITTTVVTRLVIQAEPWYHPQYLIPLLGMVFGNALTGISLSLDHLLESLDERRDRIEMALSVGASAWEASRESLREAVRRGMIPIINAMSAAGIVSLPGMMTGQILAGSPPWLAVAYQIVVMFMIAAACAIGCMLGTVLVQRRLFNERHQLCSDELRRTQT